MPHPARRTVLCCMVLLMVGGTRAQAPHTLSLGREAVFTGSALAFHGAGLLLSRRPVPEVRWPLDRTGLLRIDRCAASLWSEPSHRASNVLFGVAAGASLATVLLSQQGGNERLAPVVIVLESGFLSSGVTRMVKEAVRRPRPYLYNPGAPPASLRGHDDHLSFWSGHTANAAAITFAAAHLVQRSEAPRGVKTLVWAGAAVLPAGVGWLRVRSGRHFPTDVLTGYAFGALVGWAVPYFHRAGNGAPGH